MLMNEVSVEATDLVAEVGDLLGGRQEGGAEMPGAFQSAEQFNMPRQIGPTVETRRAGDDGLSVGKAEPGGVDLRDGE